MRAVIARAGRFRASGGVVDQHVGVVHAGGRVAGNSGGSERGSGTILAAGLALAVMIFMTAALMLAQAAVMAHRAASAADLAALAGADAARGLTTGDPCIVASETAVRHEASLLACNVKGDKIVEVRTELIRGTVFGVAIGRARAGPPP